MIRQLAIALLLGGAAPAPAENATPQFASTEADRRAIGALLSTYTTAVSTKNQALFEELLLGKDIPFSGIGRAVTPGTNDLRNYAEFRKGVFEGPPFVQRFQDVQIEQDGSLANVRLIFVNSGAGGRSWGWKTLQLVKVGSQWKIASEFYTGHSGDPPAAER